MGVGTLISQPGLMQVGGNSTRDPSNLNPSARTATPASHGRDSFAYLQDVSLPHMALPIGKRS